MLTEHDLRRAALLVVARRGDVAEHAARKLAYIYRKEGQSGPACIWDRIAEIIRQSRQAVSEM